VIPFLRIARPTRRDDILWRVLTTFTHRYNVVLCETLKLFAAISTSVSICCFDIIPLLKRQGVDDQFEKCSPFGTLSVMQKRHSFFVGFFPFLSYISFTCRVTLIPISVHCQLMLSVSRVTLTMLRQYRIMVFGVICRAVLATMLSQPFTMSGRIKKPLVASVAITSRGVSFLLGTSRTYYEFHCSILHP